MFVSPHLSHVCDSSGSGFLHLQSQAQKVSSFEIFCQTPSETWSVHSSLLDVVESKHSTPKDCKFYLQQNLTRFYFSVQLGTDIAFRSQHR